MTRNHLSRIVLALLLVPGLAAAGVEEEVRDADTRRMEAMVKGDVQALASLLAPGLTYTHSTGELQSREVFLESMSSGRLDYVAMVPSDVEVRGLGDRAAVITGRADVKVIAQGKENAVALRFTSVWFRADGQGWQMVAWQSTRLP